MSEHLNTKLSALHKSLLNGKLPRTLHWSDALELIGQLGRAEPRGHEEWTFVVGTQRELFKRAHTAELSLDEVSRLRKFLKAADAAPVAAVEVARVVVVIDHHAAHVFSPEANDPHHFRRHLVHPKEAQKGDHVPDETPYYEEVSQALSQASEIVLIGHGTGRSNAAQLLAAFLEKHHPAVFALIKATETADLSAMTDAQAEALAKLHLTPI